LTCDETQGLENEPGVLRYQGRDVELEPKLRGGKKAERKSAVLQLPSTREPQNRLHAIVWQDTLRQLRRPSCRDEIIHHLQRSLRLEDGVPDKAA